MGDEDLKLQIRSLLETGGIKLWLPPYEPISDDVAENPLKILAQNYSEVLKIDKSKIMVILEELKAHSVERFHANEQFKKTGVASLRISVPSHVNETKCLNVQTGLKVCGNELIDIISNQIKIESIRLKLIHKGKVIKRDETLEAQNVKNGVQILLIVLSENPDKIRENEDLYMNMETTKRDAELLSSDMCKEGYLRLENQSGEALDLPAKDRMSLTVAMTLHEKGRVALKSENYPAALVYLLEADRHFSDCNAEILKSVDNYALLNLDIVWCYLCLQSVTHVPEAQRRLSICEKSFHKSYGSNMERVLVLKGASGNEKALFVRLHLLQAIVLYHQNKRDEAKRLLREAEQELNSLKVDENSLCQLIELGYSATESRMGLRACNGNVESAVNFIENTRQIKKESRQRAKEQEENKKLGHCDDGVQYVSINFVQMLVDMGFSKKLAVLALKKSNNNISNAIQIIQDNPEQLNFADLPYGMDFEDEVQATEDIINKLLVFGYDMELVKRVVEMAKNFDDALDMLTGQGLLGLDCAASSSSSVEDKKKLILQKKEMKAAYKRLLNEIDTEEDDYLDLDLKQEDIFLQQYKKFFE